MTPKRCICKRSGRYPLCDGSHIDQSWCGQTPAEQITRLVIASPALSSLAEWWAAVIDGKTITETTENIRDSIEEIWVLSDGIQLPLLKLLIEQIPHQTERWIHTDSHPVLPQDWVSLRNQSHYHLPSDFELKTLDPLRLKPIQPTLVNPRRIFISHAVSDETIILPILEYLEGLYDLQFFICSKIPSQANWYTEIEQHLRDCDTVWTFLSSDFSQSTFCAFEIGMTRALKKNMILFSIDGSTPPAYLQHLQMHSVPRVQSHSPWLSQNEVLIHLCTQALNESQTSVT
jgi:hypothetical protein